MKKKTAVKPFGLEFLSPMDMQAVNGGAHHKKKHHPTHPTPTPTPAPTSPVGDTMHTMAISMPTTAGGPVDSF
jgi:hypothetical protein